VTHAKCMRIGGAPNVLIGAKLIGDGISGFYVNAGGAGLRSGGSVMLHGVNELPARTPGREPERRQRARLVASVALAGLGVVFAVLNLDEVEVNWIVGTWDTPLIIVIAISVLVGAALGYVAARRRKPS
jgi:uncharacterized integral membrane protein